MRTGIALIRPARCRAALLLPVLVAALLPALLPVAPARAEPWRLSRLAMGADVERQAVAGGDRKLASLPLSASWQQGNWLATASVPYQQVRGDGGDDIDGWGDLTLSLGRPLRPWTPGSWTISATAQLKLPTASRALGTGRADAGLTLDLAWWLDSWLPFASLGYRMTGKRNDLPMRDTIAAMAGLQRDLREDLGQGWSAGAYVSFRQSLYRSVDDYRTAVLYGTAPLGDSWSLQAYGSAALGTRAGDLGGGLHLRYSFTGK